jgi:hypothetical protein
MVSCQRQGLPVYMSGQAWLCGVVWLAFVRCRQGVSFHADVTHMLANKQQLVTSGISQCEHGVLHISVAVV